MGQLGGLSPQGSIAVGVLVGLISTSLQAIGLTLQRKSHLREDEKYPYDLRRPPYKRRRWQVGMFMFVLSNIVGSTIQLTTLPLPVLSTLQASGLVFNTIFATLILGEAFTRYSFIGTVLVCIGAVMIGTFGAIGEPAHTLDQLLELLARAAFLKWMAGTAVLVAVTLLGARILKILSAPPRTRGLPGKYSLPPSLSFHTPRLKAIRGLLFGSVSGILSAHSLLVAKSAVELLVRTIIDRVNQFNRWQSWVIVLGMIVLALTQLYYMHCGLKLCSTSILYPFVFCVYNIIAILDGLIYFRQGSEMPTLHAWLIALGTVILLFGVLCLSWRLDEAPAVGPAGAPLTPGLGIIEEQQQQSLSSPADYEDDEESQRGERQPLLLRTQQQDRSTFTPSATPSLPHRYTLPRVSPLHRRCNTTEAAEIMAELEETNGTTALQDSPGAFSPPTTPSSPLRRFHKRHHSLKSRRMSSPSSSKGGRKPPSTPSKMTSPTTTRAQRAPSNNTNNENDELTPLPVGGQPDKNGSTVHTPTKGNGSWARRSAARFLPHFQGGRTQRGINVMRRTSAPPATGILGRELELERDGQLNGRPGPSADDESGTAGTSDGYGGQPSPGPDEPETLQDTEERSRQEQPTSNPVSNAWNAGRRWLTGWMNPPSDDGR